MFLTEPWYDLRFGPLQHLWGERQLPPIPSWWCFTCELARTPIGELFEDTPATVSGVALDRETAQARVCGEALERYAGLTSEFEHTTHLPVAESSVLGMTRCASFERCPATFTSTWLEENPETQISHVRCRKFSDEQPIWIPVTSVLISHKRFAAQEPIVTEATSTGMAFDLTLTGALMKGLCEVIERDSAMISWWCRRGAKRLGQLDQQAALLRQLDQLGRSNLVPYCFDISQDLQIPTVACLLRAETFPYWTVGSACNPDPLKAIQKAIDEAISVQIMLDRQGDINTILDRKRDHDSTVSLYPDNAYQRGKYYGLISGYSPFQYLFNSPVVSVDRWLDQDWICNLDSLVSELVSRDLNPVWVDLTTEDIKSLGYVVKSIVPGMVPLTQSEYAWKDTPRLEHFRRGSWNRLPHPFA